MVSKASDDFPEPDNPVKTTSLSRGMVRSMSLRLCSRAPLITISVCCPRGISLPGSRGGVGVGDFFSATDAGPHAAGLRLAPHPGLGGRRRRHRLPVFPGLAAEPGDPVPACLPPLELHV